MIIQTRTLTLGDNVPVFLYGKNGEKLSGVSATKRANWRGFRLRDVLNDERKMQNSTPKKHPIVAKIRPIPPCTCGESLTTPQLWHWLSTGDATLRLPHCACIDSKINHRK